MRTASPAQRVSSIIGGPQPRSAEPPGRKAINRTLNVHTADGKELLSVTGQDVPGMDHRLYSALLAGFLKMKDSASGNPQLKYFTTEYASQQLACVGTARSSAELKLDSPNGIWPAYCFGEHEPVLIASHENSSITNLYSQPQKFQNHNFAGQIEISYNGKKRVEAKLEDLSEVHADDAAFTPSPDAKEYAPQTHTIRVIAAPQ
jgi:hypothetical protein